MTQKDKIEVLKTTILFLYEKEGRSKSYISKLLEVDRKVLTEMINEWGLVQANIPRLTPSNQKFLNKHRNLIKSRLDDGISQIKIAKELGVSRDYLRNIISKDSVLTKANQDYINRLKKKSAALKQKQMEESSRNYIIEDLANEEWKEIVGYSGYFVSSLGRIKKYSKRYGSYFLLTPTTQQDNGRLYVSVKDKYLQVSRLVGFAFVQGYSEINNTIDHIDGDKTNNCCTNLQWVSQSENNKRAYKNGKKKSVAYSKHGKFKKIMLDNEYEFKTLTALAKFLNVSTTQLNRYISGESSFNRKIEFIY